MKTKLCIILCVFCLTNVFSQSEMGINTETMSPSAVFEVVSSDKGVLIPRLSATQRMAIAAPDTGLMVYDSTFQFFYYFDGSSWLQLRAGLISELSDADNDTKIQVEKTADEDKIRFDLGGTEKWTMLGNRLESTNTGLSTFIGGGSGNLDDGSNNLNVAVGDSTLYNNTIGDFNSALGYKALYSNTNGSRNVGVGLRALFSNTSGLANVSVGFKSLSSNTEGSLNTGVGGYSLQINTTGSLNSALGYSALRDNVTGERNSASGGSSLHNNVSGSYNTANGFGSLSSNTVGSGNTAMGHLAQYYNDSGSYNTAIGDQALFNTPVDSMNSALGYQAGYNSMGSGNLLLGYQAGYNETGSNRLYIENSKNDSTGALIYGEFDNDFIRINGKLIATMGLNDADMDTKIQLEETADEDIIRFDLAGTEKWIMEGSRLEPNNSGFSVFIGDDAGLNDDLSGNENVNIGYKAGESNVTGDFNTAVGARAMRDINGGARNVAFGYLALGSATTGSANTALGAFTLNDAGVGSNNTAVGRGAGFKNTGSSNVFLGNNAGNNNTGSSNVFLGNTAGYDELGSDLLYIENSMSTTPLIWGDFSNNRVGINFVATTNALEVGGDASKTSGGNWLANSDKRLKKNISYLDSEKILQKVLQMKGVNYEWNDDKTGMKRPEGIMYGFIAQDLEQVWPTKVKEDNQGYLQTAYGDYDPMFVEAIKALYAQNQELMQMMEVQIIRNESLKAEVVELSAMKDQISALSKRLERIEEVKALGYND
jgi:hypothetical protein